MVGPQDPTDGREPAGSGLRCRRVLTAAAVIAFAGGDGAHFLLCGPPRFLSHFRSGLEQNAIAPGHIRFETLGPG